jgi:hypothetical protein
MVSSRGLQIFLLGSFGDLTPGGSKARGVLERLRQGLRSLGWDAYISGDRPSLELTGSRLPPRRMTEVLEPLAGLSIFVATVEGRPDGWVSELTALQIKNPRGAERRALLVEVGYPLSSILDPEQEGYLSDPPILVFTWKDEQELLAEADVLANFVVRLGRLP